jgi:hypothetical protein
VTRRILARVRNKKFNSLTNGNAERYEIYFSDFFKTRMAVSASVALSKAK